MAGSPRPPRCRISPFLDSRMVLPFEMPDAEAYDIAVSWPAAAQVLDNMSNWVVATAGKKASNYV